MKRDWALQQSTYLDIKVKDILHVGGQLCEEGVEAPVLCHVRDHLKGGGNFKLWSILITVQPVFKLSDSTDQSSNLKATKFHNTLNGKLSLV